MANRAVRIFALTAVCAVAASASTISGTFQMSGLITVTTNTITWNSDASGNASDMFTFSNGTGSFAGVPNSTQESIVNLDTGTEPVASTFTAVPFMTIAGVGALNINYIYQGVYSSSGCTTTPAAPGQTCTPNQFAAGGKSPFSFTNNPPPDAPTSSAQFVFAGVTSDGAQWNAIFTTQFSVPFQTVLAAFQNGGSGQVPNVTYSANVTVSPVPEPSSIGMFGAGLGLLAFAGFSRRRANR